MRSSTLPQLRHRLCGTGPELFDSVVTYLGSTTMSPRHRRQIMVLLSERLATAWSVSRSEGFENLPIVPFELLLKELAEQLLERLGIYIVIKVSLPIPAPDSRPWNKNVIQYLAGLPS